MALKKLYTPTDIKEAYFLRAQLEGEEIQVHIQGETDNILSFTQAMNLVAPLSLWVPEEKFAQAQEFLNQYFQGPGETTQEKWSCPGCGEEQEPQFSECWKCGTGRKE